MALLLGTAMQGITLGTAAMQAQGPPPDISFSVNGTITEQSPGKLTVDSGQNMLFTVKYDSTTQIQNEDGSPARASDLRVGVKILAKGTLTEAGDVIAKAITIEPGSKGPAK
jgi:predicted NAD/FAD-binding protein